MLTTLRVKKDQGQRYHRAYDKNHMTQEDYKKCLFGANEFDSYTENVSI